MENQWKLLDAYNEVGEDAFARKEAQKLPKKTDSSKSYYVYDTNALILKAYRDIFGKFDKELYDLVLSSARTNEWMSTFEKANIVQALAGDAKNSPEKKDLSFKVIVDGKEEDLELKNGDYSFTNLGIKGNAKKIVIRNTSSDKLYINSFYKGKPIKYDEKDESKNITITRKFVDMSGKEIDVKNLKVGTKFRMILTTKMADNNFANVALLQILPSGWEFDNTQINTESSIPLTPEDIDKAEYGGAANVVDYTDIRDDRVAFFYILNSGDEKLIAINLVAVTPGTYRLPGTKVEGMYSREHKAYLKGFEVKVKE